jgi:hypothetical protein
MIDNILLDEIKFNYSYDDFQVPGEEEINKVKVLDSIIVKYTDNKDLSGFIVIDNKFEIPITYDNLRKRVMEEIKNKVNDAPIKIGEGLYMKYDIFIDGICKRLVDRMESCSHARNNLDD